MEEMSPVKKSKVLPSKGKKLSKEKSTKGKNPINKMKQVVYFGYNPSRKRACLRNVFTPRASIHS